MKTSKFLLYALLLLFVSNLSAQEGGNTSKLGYGFNIGASLNSFNSFSFDQTRIGLNGGIFASYAIINWVNVSAEINYQQLGATDIDPHLIYYEESPALENLVETDISIKNVDMAVILKFSIPNFAGSIKPIILAGPAYGYCFKSWARNTRVDIQEEEIDLEKTFEDVTPRFASSNYALIAGIGAAVDAAPLSLSGSVRYRYGLSDLNNVSGLEEINAHTISLVIGIGF